MREFTVVTQPAEEEQFTKEVIRTTDGWSIYGGSDANLIDGDLTTKVHYNVRQKGEPANTTIPGDYVGVKLSKPITLGKINILQGNTDSDGDYFKDADLQYSLDGKTWTTVETYKNTINIVTDLSDQNITAQYVRLVNKVNQNTWIAMREFDVAAKVYHNGKVFTNVSEYKSLTADYLDESAKITPAKGITLANGDYVGLKLDRIHELKDIVSELTNDSLTIQVSKNSYEWQNVNAGNVSADARYVRIINNNEAEVTFDLNKFIVNTVEIKEKSITSSNFSIDKPLNVFDGDLTTATAYQGSQNVDKYFTYDLGQEITLNSFKAICTDSEWDYPRHGKFSVSTDGETWTEIMLLGNQNENNPGEAENTDEIGFVLPSHEISYNAKK